MKTSVKLFRKLRVIALISVVAATFVGCKTINTYNQKRDTTLGKKRKVENVFQHDTLPEHLRRVAMLPLYKGRYDHLDLDEVQESFIQELIKRNIFEVVTLTEEEMEDMFGFESYSSQEPLPAKLLTKLHNVYAIDGVMLVDLSFFSPYQPVGLGVRATLIDGHTGEIEWAADELFDSSNPQVANAARKYFQTESIGQYPLHQTQTVLHSPKRFSKYVAAAIFDTIH